MHSEHPANACASDRDARQRDARQDFDSALERLIDVLAEESPIKPTVSSFDTLAGAALARASRRVGQDARERRQLARMLLSAALLNHANPDWNPADAATDRANHDDPFVALLQGECGSVGLDQA